MKLSSWPKIGSDGDVLLMPCVPKRITGYDDDDVVLQILREDLGKRKLCERFVPQSLTPEQREDRVTSCQDISMMADADKNFLTKLLQEVKPGALKMTPKQSDRVLNGLVRHPLS